MLSVRRDGLHSVSSHNCSMGIWEAFLGRSGLAEPDLRTTVLALSRIPYGRPDNLTATGVIAAWRGTCSTKHLQLRDLLAEHWPSMGVQLWHRVYRLMPELARARWGPEVASVVPVEGLIDVHNYATVTLAGQRLVLDVTFATSDWDGKSSMEVASGPGRDLPAGHDLIAEKQQLVSANCDPSTREPVISALSALLGADR